MNLGGQVDGIRSGGGAMVHPANSVAGLWTTVTTNNVNVVYDHPVSTMEGRGDSTATGTAVAVVPDISTTCLLYTSPSPRDRQKSRMPSSA